MQTAILILQHLLLHYGKDKVPANDVQAADSFWSKDVLLQISYLLFRHNISSRVSRLPLDMIYNSPFAGIIEQTDDLGQTFYYHWHKGEKKLLFAKRYTTEGAYTHNIVAGFLAYDKAALEEKDLGSTFSGTVPGFRSKAWPVVLMLVLLLCWDFFRKASPILLLLQLSSLANMLLSLLLLFKERHVFNQFTERFCASTVYEGCNKLIDSGASRLFKQFTLAQAGTWIYLALFLCTLFVPVQESYIGPLALLPFAALLVSVLLVLKMIFIRTFCKLCLWIHTVNLLTCIAWFLLDSAIFAWQWPERWYEVPLLLTGCLLLAALAVSFLIRFTDLLQQRKATGQEIKGLKYTLLQRILEQGKDTRLQQTRDIAMPLDIACSADTDVELTLVLSLHCHFCAELIGTIEDQGLRSKIGMLRIYLFADVSGPEVVALAEKLQRAAGAEERFAVLNAWYRHDGLQHMPAVPEEATTQPGALPGFCLPKSLLPYEELPTVFINRVYLPHSYGAADLEALLFFFSLQPASQVHV